MSKTLTATCALCACSFIACAAPGAQPAFLLQAIARDQTLVATEHNGRAWDFTLAAGVAFQTGADPAGVIATPSAPPPGETENLQNLDAPCSDAALCAWEATANASALVQLAQKEGG